MGQNSGIGRRWKFGWCQYIEVSRTLLVHDKRINIEGKPRDVLLLLLEEPDRVVPKEQIVSSVWENTSEQSLAVAISKLRKAFGGGKDDIIINVAGQGYRMAVPVTCEFIEHPLPPAPLLDVGSTIPKRPNWRGIERLGGNDSSPVWLARHEKTGEDRVYKLATDGIRLRALQREVTVARLLQKVFGKEEHSFVKILDWNFDDEPFFTESEYIGLNLFLFAEIDAFQQMSPAERVHLIALLADAVALAHGLGILHNDLKPSNVLIRSTAISRHSDMDSSIGESAPGDQPCPALVDFGVASILDMQMLRQMDITDHGSFEQGPGPAVDKKTTAGTVMYIAPELRWGGTPTVQADVYSLGVMLFQVITGDLKQTPSAGWESQITDPLLREDIAAAAHIDPRARIKTAADLAERLHSLEGRRLIRAETLQKQVEAQRLQEQVARSRTRRPWVVAAAVLLVLGILSSLWSFRSAVQQRDAANRHNRTLLAMLNFLSEDLIGQSNPSSGAAGSDKTTGQTLVGAINTAIPQIDRRFAHEPEIAAELHETIADSLLARTQFVEADREYVIAAARYRSVQGLLSQSAIAVELKREGALMSSLLPGNVEQARAGFEKQSKLIQQLSKPTAKVQALQGFVDSGLIGLGPDPNKAIPPLAAAIERARTISDFDPRLLIKMKARYCGLYVRMANGPKLEQCANELIGELSKRFGKDSATLVSYEMYLQEAYYLEGNYQKAIQQSEKNYERFKNLVGPDNQYTLGTLANRAASEAQLGRYEDAVRDDLQLYHADASNPSGLRMKEGSLNDAALFECHLGHYHDGEAHARQVIRDTSPGSASQPAFYNGSTYILAECLIGEQETKPKSDPRQLREAEVLLRRVDPQIIAQLTGETAYSAFVHLSRARLAFLQKHYSAAGSEAEGARSYFEQPGADPYEGKIFKRLTRELTAHLYAETRG